jgi:hypothetical protein
MDLHLAGKLHSLPPEKTDLLVYSPLSFHHFITPTTHKKPTASVHMKALAGAPLKSPWRSASIIAMEYIAFTGTGA